MCGYVACKRVDIRVAGEDDEKFAEPYHLCDMLRQSAVSFEHIQAIALPLVSQDKVHVSEPNVLSNQHHCCQSEDFNIDKRLLVHHVLDASEDGNVVRMAADAILVESHDDINLA